MSKIVIKKRVNLGFLGEEYQEAYLLFKSIPVSEYEKIQEKIPETSERFAELVKLADTGEITEDQTTEFYKLKAENSEANSKSFKMVLEILKEYYLAGKFPNDKGEIEDVDSVDELEGLDQDAVIKCFSVLTGQDSGPKGQSTKPSSTEPEAPTNS